MILILALPPRFNGRIEVFLFWYFLVMLCQNSFPNHVLINVSTIVFVWDPRRIEVLAFYFLWFCNTKTSDDSCWISYNMQVSDQPILYYFSFCANFFGGFLWRKVWFLKKFCEGKSYSLEFLRRKVWCFSNFCEGKYDF